jgi:hypothetical protein
MAKKKSTAKTTSNKSAQKNSLVANINRRKKAGTSRSKKDSTISPEAYKKMQLGWGKKKTKKGVKKKSASPSRRKTAKRKISS